MGSRCHDGQGLRGEYRAGDPAGPNLLLESQSGAEACDAIWQSLKRNQVSGQRGVVVSLQAEA